MSDFTPYEFTDEEKREFPVFSKILGAYANEEEDKDDPINLLTNLLSGFDLMEYLEYVISFRTLRSPMIERLEDVDAFLLATPSKNSD